jgi:RimJ/RimL family protein N-acetyltransferase
MIRTERLVLRQWQESDREPFAELNADAEVMRYFPSTLSVDQSDALVDRASLHLAETGWGLWAVERDDVFLGFAGLAVPRFDAPFLPGVEIGWRFARHAWGQGYATEAARAALAFAFDVLTLDEVLSFTAEHNDRSRAVMRRLGMRHVGDFEHPNIEERHPLRHHVLYRIERLPS